MLHCLSLVNKVIEATELTVTCQKPATNTLPLPYLQIVDHEPTMIEDYDPYKLDVGFYSPYDSRLSLNRHYQANIGGMGGSFASGNDSGEHFFSHQQRQQSPATSGGTSAQQINITTNGVGHHHHRENQPQLLNSYSPVENSGTQANRPTVAAVRQVANPNRVTVTGNQHISSRHNRQQVPVNSQAHFDSHSPRSIRSQQFY